MIAPTIAKENIQTLDFLSKSHGINADYAKHDAARFTDLPLLYKEKNYVYRNDCRTS